MGEKVEKRPVDILLDQLQSTKGFTQLVLEKSGIKEFCNAQMVTNPIGAIQYVDFVNNSDLNLEDTLTLSMHQTFFRVSIFQTTMDISNEQIQDIEAIYDINPLNIIYDAVLNKLTKELSQSVIKRIYKISHNSYRKTFNSWDNFKLFVYSIFNKKYIKKIKVKNVQKLITYILSESNKIFKNGRIGGATHVICNLKTACALSSILLDDNKHFKESPIEQTFGQPYLYGEIAGLKVYVDPYMHYKDNSIYIFRKSDQNQPGVYAAFLENSDNFDIITENMQIKLRACMNFAIFDVGDRKELFYRKIVYKGL